MTDDSRRTRTSTWSLVLFCGILGASEHASAGEPVVFEAGPDWDIIVNGQVRPRLYMHSGNDFRGSASEWRETVTQRSRLGLTAEEASGLALKVEIQDVRVWGEEDDTLADVSAEGFDVRQAYGFLPLIDTLSLKLGRQEISLDNERLIGDVAWSQRGRTFDAVRVQWSGLRSILALDALYSKIQETGQNPEGAVPPGRTGDVDLAGLRASVEYYPEQELAPLYLLRSNQARDELRHTVGLSASGHLSGFRYSGEFYYQLGELDGDRIDALLAAARLSYTVDVEPQPRITAWGELISGGDGDPAGSFDTLYATNHKFYGEMDFFLNIPVDTANLGLVDIGGRLGSDIVPRLRAHVDFHHFRTEDTSASGQSVLGHEVNAVLAWQVHDYVSLRCLYGHFWPGEAMRDVMGVKAPTLALPASLGSEHLVFLTTDVSF